MKVTKILETRIDIFNINDIYCADYNKNIINILKEKYVKKCFKAIYILDVLRIVHRSSLHCKNKVLDGSTYIDVSFEVYGIVYEKGEVIHDCKIISINAINGTMHAKSEHASILIKNIKGIIVFKETDVIPVIVNMARYTIFESEISLSAIPFIPILAKPTMFKITSVESDIKKQVSEIIDFKKLDALEKKIDLIKKSNKAVYKFFHDLVYPYKALQKVSGTVYNIDLESLLMLKIDSVYYKADCHLDDNTYLKLTSADIIKLETKYATTAMLEIDAKDYIIHLFDDKTKRLNILLDLLELYDSSAKIKSKSPVWSLYNLFKV